MTQKLANMVCPQWHTASKDYGTLLDKYSTGWIVFTLKKPRQKKCEKQKETIVIPKETIIVTEEQKQCD